MLHRERASSQRIVSLAPAGNLPKLGDCWSLDAERVSALRPTRAEGARELYRVLHGRANED